MYAVYYIITAFEIQVPFLKPKPTVNTVDTKRLPSIASQILAALFLAMRFLFLTMATTTLSIYNCTYDEKADDYYFEPVRKLN